MKPLLYVYLELLLPRSIVDEVGLNGLQLTVVGGSEIKLCRLGSILINEETSEFDGCGVDIYGLLERVTLSHNLY